MDILVCDDDINVIETIKLSLNRIENARLYTFTNPVEALMFSVDHKIDMAILDIIMPKMSGVELAKKLRDNSFNGEIIFLTSSNDYATESYAVKAYDYILKPVSQASLLDIYNRVAQMNQYSEQFVSVVRKHIITKIEFSNIIFIEAHSRQIHFNLNRGEVLSISGSLKEYINLIDRDMRFAIPHASYIVNMDYVKTIKNQEIILHNGRTISISRRQSNFKKQYLKYIAKEE